MINDQISGWGVTVWKLRFLRNGTKELAGCAGVARKMGRMLYASIRIQFSEEAEEWDISEGLRMAWDLGSRQIISCGVRC